MADHLLVETVLSWLGNWDQNNAPQPVFIDRDDAESDSFNDRRTAYDLTDNHAISVASTPDRQTTPIGTNYDLDVEDGVSVRIEGAHVDQFGTISDAGSFQDIVDEAKRLILAERTSFPSVNGTDYHSVLIDDESNVAAQHRDYFRYDLTVLFRGYEDL